MESLKGQFLISMPEMADPNFSESVTLICEHTADGAVGIVINRVHPFITGHQIAQELKLIVHHDFHDMPILAGGPVHLGEVFIIHGTPTDWLGSMEITPGIAMSSAKDLLVSITQNQGPQSYIIALGCAGWGANQLESEIMQNAWLNFQADKDIIFNTPMEDKWESAIRKMGIEPSFLTNTAGHA